MYDNFLNHPEVSVLNAVKILWKKSVDKGTNPQLPFVYLQPNLVIRKINIRPPVI